MAASTLGTDSGPCNGLEARRLEVASKRITNRLLNLRMGSSGCCWHLRGSAGPTLQSVSRIVSTCTGQV